MSEAEIREAVGRIQFLDRRFRLLPKGDGFLLQVVYDEKDVDTGEMAEQHARKWYVSPHATETEVVETAFAAVKRSMEHVVGEHFLYRGRRVYGPHFRIEDRQALCEQGRFDAREKEPKP